MKVTLKSLNGQNWEVEGTEEEVYRFIRRMDLKDKNPGWTLLQGDYPNYRTNDSSNICLR